jgi:hypothetical protein
MTQLSSKLYAALLEISMMRDAVRSFGEDLSHNDMARLLSHLHLLERTALRLTDHLGTEQGATAH